ncbi:hypothetical protein N7U66_09595 [Lacinutrix neustonica]|uniref:Uncharacterized protein n=1 Tax=Lacinutrix neustonica TaxID=2980107 RepID=A0A9E8MXU7_9FLAO|nr:hypothetical protein [Lacinutrix neustonica]WAC03673.1 hypothetical protein N7U66_09595 [Lacinutrix neustonica]
MKNFILLVNILFTLNVSFAQDNESDLFAASTETHLPTNFKDRIGSNGFAFRTLDVGINTKYSEYGSGFFMNKFIMVSSKKLGGLAKRDKATGEGFKSLYCLDIDKNGGLRLPLLFSEL